MFDLSFPKILVLVVVALFVLGPERLPAAAAWVGGSIRRVKSFAAGAHEQLRSELGPEIDQLRQPLAELRAPLQELRSLGNPRAAVMRHLFNDTDPLSGQPAGTPADASAATTAVKTTTVETVVKPVTAQQVPAQPALAPNNAPPIDIDAT